VKSKIWRVRSNGRKTGSRWGKGGLFVSSSAPVPPPRNPRTASSRSRSRPGPNERSRYNSAKSEYESAKDDYESKKSDLESGLDDVVSRIRDVESSCDYPIISGSAGRRPTTDRFCALLRRYKGRGNDQMLMVPCLGKVLLLEICGGDHGRLGLHRVAHGAQAISVSQARIRRDAAANNLLNAFDFSLTSR